MDMLKSLSTLELIKIKFDECHNILTENYKNMKLEIAKVVKERDSFEKELSSLQKTQASEKASLERKCNELEKWIEEMEVENQRLEREKSSVEKKLKVDAKERMEEMKIEVQKLEVENETLRSRMLQLKQLADLEDPTNSPHQPQTGSKILMTSQPNSKEDPRKRRMVQRDKKFSKKASVQGASHSTIFINRRCDLNIINRIKKKLDQENLERFEQSCFGHLLGIGELKFQGQLLLQLVTHMDMDASNEETGLVFRIGNSNKEFRPNKFAEITGLNHGGSTSEATKTCSSIREHVFGGSTSITLKDVEKAFNSSVSRGRGDLPLKLALLYFLFGVLINKTTRSSSSKINNDQLQYLDLVEDLEKFNAFPWGRVAYHCLASSIMSAGHHLDRESHNIYGFSFALQVWAYEMIPGVAEHCAIPLAENTFENPPILRWSTVLRSIRFNELNEFFTPSDKAHSVLHCDIEASPKQKNKIDKMPTSSTANDPTYLPRHSSARIYECGALDQSLGRRGERRRECEGDWSAKRKRQRNQIVKRSNVVYSTDSDEESC